MAKLTQEQIDRIIELREGGKYGTRIAQIMGIPPATVNYQLLRAGLDPWDPSRRSPGHKQPNGFSEADDQRMLELAKTMPIHRVAETMERAITSVRIRLMTLEVRAEKALERAA